MVARTPWLLFAVAGSTATALYAAGVATTAMFLLVGAGGVIAVTAGPRRHGAEPYRPFNLLGAAAALFLAGAVVRPFVVDGPGGVPLIADAFSLPGYLCVIASLASLLHVRTALQRHAVIDGLIVCVGAGVGAILVLLIPAVTIDARPPLVSLFAGLYPLLDVLLVLLVANLAFTSAARQPSFLLFGAMMLCVLAGDVGYAVIGTRGELYGSHWLDVPFLAAFVLCGTAGLHPSVRDLVRATPLPVQAWSWPRLMVIVPALAMPSLLTATIAGRSPAHRLVIAAGGAVIVTLLLVRAISAVQHSAVMQRRYQHQATHDALTGLPNRQQLVTTVERMAAEGGLDGDTRIWMFLLDLDGFKIVNESWGHPAGDQLIIDVGRRLRTAMPPTACVARVGGDEFVVVACCDRDGALGLAQQIMDVLQVPLIVGGAEVTIGASMGIAGAGDQDGTVDLVALGLLDPAHGTSQASVAESLMRDADTAMYRTKAAGRGGWTIFDASMYEAVRERLEIESALRSAVAQEQLTVAYQPIVDLPTGDPAGAEALVRWDHPTRGPVPPAEFIPIAEDSRLICTIGAWVLRQAVRQLAAWRADGTVTGDFWMSINVSPRQLTDPDLPASLADELHRCGVPAACVVLEITESVMVEASPVTEGVLLELRELGVRISVDDFGTGYSALGYLRRHPVTGVKIDRSFVSGLGTDPEDGEIVRAVVAMSLALGLAVVAEGVETARQRDALAALGVPFGQGWLWGRAVPPAAFAAWAPAARRSRSAVPG